MSSNRLPRKMLQNIGDMKLVDHVFNNLSEAENITDVVIATSKNDSDDELVNYCQRRNIECFRGNLDDVASRFLQISQDKKASAFVRISGDSPLIDPTLIDQLVVEFQNENADLITNVQVRSFPKGQSVEVLNSRTFREAYKNFDTNSHFEHVTQYFYENSSSFRIKNIESHGNYRDINLSVDTDEDLARLKQLIQHNIPIAEAGS